MAVESSSWRYGRVGCGKLACVLAASLAASAQLSHGGEPLDYHAQLSVKQEPPREYSEEEIAEIVPEWPNPYLSFLPVEATPDYAYWKARARLEARARQDRRTAATSAALATLVVGSDDEPNDTRETASFVPGFGTHDDADREARIDGTFTPPPETAIGPFAEDDGSIPLASETGLAGRGAVRASGAVGDGPFGSGGARTGDFDFFHIGGVAAGQTILIDVDTPVGSLDSVVALYDATGALLAVNDDSSGTLDSFLQLVAPAAGDYYVSIGGYPAVFLADPFDSASGPGSASEGSYEVRIGVDPDDVDHFGFELEAGDILGATVSGAGTRLELYAPDGELRVGSSLDATFIHPPASPLPGGGNAALSYVIETPGTWTIRASGDPGAYRMDLRVETNPLLEGEEGDVQILFLDFDGATVDASIFGGSPGLRTLSPLAAFLPGWGLGAADQDAVIDAILAAVEESLSVDMRVRGGNGDFDTSGRPGEFDIEIRNSRDHPDPGADPNLSRVLIGGTIPQLGIPTIGIAQSIDVGNFETQETAVVLLDLLSAPAPNSNSLNTFPLAPGAARLDIVGVGVGNIAAHEAGHFFGNFHTEQFVTPPNVMDQGGNLANTVGVGPDGIFGSADDVDVDFGRDSYVPNEGFAGVEDTLNSVAFGLPTPVVAIPVGVDVRPGNDENQVNLESAGLIPIALLGSASFDVTQVDVATLAIGAAGSRPDGKVQTKDASQDGFKDLVFHVRPPATALAPGDAELCVAGQLLDGRPIAGCDAVRIVPELCAFGPGAGGGLLHPAGPENGDFERGNLTGWQQINTGFGEIVIDDGQRFPPGGGGRVLPFEGSFDALTEQLGPGQHTLFVDFTLDADLAEARLAWADHLRNLAGSFVDPIQEWRVEVWDPASNAVLAQLHSTQPGDPLFQDWTERDADLSPWIGRTIRIAFTEQDSLFYFNARLDRVQVLVRRRVDSGIDIQPGDARNAINPMSQGVVPVALLGSDSFDVRRIDVLTLSFGPGGARPAHQICREEVFEGHVADVDLDGDEDLLVHFETPESGIAVGDYQACVTGETLDGVGFSGCDAIATVPGCGLGFELVLLAPMLRRLGRRRPRLDDAGEVLG